ncbi:MAG: hypothetical protein Kow0069_02420 [Promethearchaeota archaeon]
MRTKKIGTLALAFALLGSFASVGFFRLASASLPSTLGHDFDETAWSVLYDFAGDYLEKDYNPGPLATSLNEGLVDSDEAVDNKYFGAYVQVGGVQTLYLAMQNFSWGLNDLNATLYGCSPYQVLVQHFRPPSEESVHIVVANTFLGLLAYRDNLTAGILGVPDQNDELYVGWSYRSEFHKFLVNLVFALNGLPEWVRFDEGQRTTATPVPLAQDGSTYKFGMTYRNVFVLWQKISITENLDGALTGAEVLEKCSAFALLDELNFTFVVSYEKDPEADLWRVATTTEYDVGPMSGLWVVGDDAGTAAAFNGSHFQLAVPAVEFSYYNGSAAASRVDGNATTPGFGLAVMNTANVMAMDLSAGLLQSIEYSGGQDFVDQTGQTLGVSDKNLTSAAYEVGDDPAYEIDFASKPTYLLNEATELAAPTRTVRNDAVAIDPGPGPLVQLFLSTLEAGFVGNVTGDGRAFLYTFLHSAEVDFYYLTCFPVWSGGTISQDPVFVVYTNPPAGRDVAGFPLFVALAASALAVATTSVVASKRKRLSA